MADLPAGTITFLFTDIEGSTQRWEQHPEAMPATLARHDAILRTATEAHGGVVFRTVGDAFCTAFANAPAALRAALDAQRALYSEPWGEMGPLRVRMALHTGGVELRDGEYQGQPLNRIARLLATGHGGQTLLTLTSEELVRDHLPLDVTLRDLGTHRLKDLTRPEQIFQLLAPDLPADFPPLKTLDRRPHNLPAQSTTLIGREKEVTTVCSLLRRADVRLVTLTGPGGTGKTRLALQTAAEQLDEFRDGAWFVNLAPISAPDLVATTIAQVLGVRERDGRPLLDHLKDYLREKQLLLLLDNFEQVVDAAPLVSELLAAAPGLNVLATSRMPLHLSGEREYAVPPLGLPSQELRTKNQEPSSAAGAMVLGSRFSVLSSATELTQYEAVRLFIERAQAVKADFAVTNANAPAVAEICERLDGLPLAIELAAVRVKLFPPQALLTRLGSRLQLLTGGARDLPVRQQTIRNTIDWSYQLLDEGEKRLFSRLGVFVGGWTLEAAEAVASELRIENEEVRNDHSDGDIPHSQFSILDLHAALVDQSLVRQDEGLDGEPRFVMLETIREYALERLAERGEVDAIRQQHANSFLTLAEAAEPWLRGASRGSWLERLEAEHDNLRAALEWFSTHAEAEPGLRLAGALRVFWFRRFHWGEGRARLEAALVQSTTISRAVRAKALLVVARLAQFQGELARARAYAEESLALSRALGDQAGSALALSALAGMITYQGDLARARAYAEESLALSRALGDTFGIAEALGALQHVVGNQGDSVQAAALNAERLTFNRQLGDKEYIAIALCNVGVEAQLQGDWERAIALYTESLALAREMGNKSLIVTLLFNLGCGALHEGDAQRAVSCFTEGLHLSREIGYPAGIAMNLAGMAGVAAVHSRPERSARLLGAAEALHEAIGEILDPADRVEYDRYHAIARAALAEEAFSAAWAEGRTMPLEQAIAEALEPQAETPPAPTPSPTPQPTVAAAEYPAGLTAREVEVLRLVANGLTDAQVAERLVVSAHTVHAHLRSIYGKLEVSSRAAATRFAVDHQLV